MLVFVHKISSRLQYACDFILDQYFGIDYLLTTDVDLFSTSSGPRLNYSSSSIHGCYKIQPANLLFEKTITEQKIDCFDIDGYKAFFKSAESDFSFDIFAAVFYLLSRYEEYLPHTKDDFGRYAHQNSLAFKEGFLQQPLVDIWLTRFAESLHTAYPTLVFTKRSFRYLPTYDIDIAWSYKHKGFLRDMGGLVLKPSPERIQVLRGKAKDPYDCYELLHRLHNAFDLKPTYFFLVASTPGRYDKNSNIAGEDLKALIKDHAEKYSIGIHPSWKSNEQEGLLAAEKEYLEKQIGRNIVSSRQHYLKFTLPETFKNLINVGIKNDYSMGYGKVNGFRASTATSFFWYDLKEENQTDLLVHPFCFMDATSHFQKGLTAQEAYAEMLYYYSVCKEVGGNMITIFHNNILGGGEDFNGWPEMYERFISVVTESAASNQISDSTG